MTRQTDTAFPFDIDEEIAIRRKELDREIAHIRTAEADFDDYGVEGTPHLKEMADLLDALIVVRQQELGGHLSPPFLLRRFDTNGVYVLFCTTPSLQILNVYRRE